MAALRGKVVMMEAFLQDCQIQFPVQVDMPADTRSILLRKDWRAAGHHQSVGL